MVTFSQQIEDAIKVVQGKQVVFTATDVAEYAGLDGAEIRIAPVLQKHCGTGELLNLDGRHSPNRRYMRQVTAERWWVKQTLRWAELGLNYLTPEQLAGAMSLSFGEPRWGELPQNLLAVGRQWAMVDDGCVPGTYVSPWASVLRANPHFLTSFRTIFDFRASPYRWDAPRPGRAPARRSEASPYRWDAPVEETYLRESWAKIWATPSTAHQTGYFVDLAVDEALDRLIDKQAEIIRRRRGIGTGSRETLEQIGKDLGVTRERIRQIESRALKHLKVKSRLSSLLFCGFAALFIRSGGSLLIADSEITPQWEILSSAINLKTAAIPELEFQVIAFATDLVDYRNGLGMRGTSETISEEPTNGELAKALRFLSHSDAAQLLNAEQGYSETLSEINSTEAVKTRPRMVYQVMRSLGRAAHYREIAEECNRMFPGRQSTTHSWHAALMLPESIELGVVWIGRKGMYGLKEQGYERPSRDLFTAVASIVENRFANTGRPVSFDFVMQELSKERQDPDRNSVLIALGINDWVESLGGGWYIPKELIQEPDSSGGEEGYDMDAGFEAL